MIRSGILGEDDPVELINGCLVTKMPKSPLHSTTTGLLEEAITRLLPSGWCLRVQEPVTTSDSEPEPDLALVRGRRRDFARRHPTPKEVVLVVEVADTSLVRDRTIKKHLYAATRIPQYWIVDLTERSVEVHARPTGTGGSATYRSKKVFKPGQRIPLRLDGRIVGGIDAGEIFP